MKKSSQDKKYNPLHPLSKKNKELYKVFLIIPTTCSNISYKSLFSYTIFWFYSSGSLVRATFPVQGRVLNKRDTQQYLVVTPSWNHYNFYSKWVSSATLLSNIFNTSFFSYQCNYTFVGYNYQVEYAPNVLLISIGFSHLSVLPVPYNIFVVIENKRFLKIFSNSIQDAGKFADKLTKLRRPNIYTGKGLLPAHRQLTLKKTK